MKKNHYGVLYIVTTSHTLTFIRAAIASAWSVKRYSPSLGTHIFTDEKGLDYIRALSDSPVDSVGLIEKPHYRSKVDYISQSPFDRTLYLDSDTRVIHDIRELFGLLDRFDIALAQAHNRNSSKTSQVWNVDIPSSFPQYNGGVLLYKNSEKVTSFLKKWGDSFHKAGFKKDQVTLRELLWLSDLRLATLPPEYNIRHEKYIKLWSRSQKEAKPRILHMAKFHKNILLSLTRTIKSLLLRISDLKSN